MLLQKIQFEKVLKLSPAWINLFEYVQLHPFVTFEKLEFVNGEPSLGTQELKITESIRF